MRKNKVHNQGTKYVPAAREDLTDVVRKGIEEMLKSPKWIIEAYRVIMGKCWFKSRIEFNSDGGLKFNNPGDNYKIQYCEFFDLFIQILAFASVAYIDMQLRHHAPYEVYRDVSWIHSFIHGLTAFVSVICVIIAGLVWHHAKDVAIGFNALLAFKNQLDLGKLKILK